MPNLENQTAELQLDFTQGDNVALLLQAVDDSGLPVNLTGATLSTLILGPNGAGPVTFGNSKHTLGNQVAAPGTFTLTLTQADTALVGAGLNKDVLTEVTIGGLLITYRGLNILNVYAPVPAQ